MKNSENLRNSFLPTILISSGDSETPQPRKAVPAANTLIAGQLLEKVLPTDLLE